MTLKMEEQHRKGSQAAAAQSTNREGGRDMKSEKVQTHDYYPRLSKQMWGSETATLCSILLTNPELGLKHFLQLTLGFWFTDHTPALCLNITSRAVIP